MATKQATHFRPSDASSIQILAGENGGFFVLVNCGGGLESRDPSTYITRSGAAFSTAEECGAYVLGVLKNVTERKFGAQKAMR